MGFEFILIAGVLMIGLGQAALSNRRNFELRMQLLEVIELAMRRGLPIIPPLRKSTSGMRRRVRASITQLARDLEQGEGLSEALEWAVPDSFPPHVRAMIQAAEGSAELPAVLRSLLQQTEDRIALQHRLMIALLYPAALVFGLLLLSEFWLPVTAITPLVAGVPAVPWFGAGFSVPIGLLAMGFFCTLLAWHMLWRRSGLLRRLGRDYWARLPWCSPAGHLLASEQFLTSLAFLVRGGVTIPTAMRRSVGAAGSPRMEASIRSAAVALDEGASFEDALRSTGLPAFAVASIVASGGGSPGQLADAMQRGAREAHSRFLTARERLLGILGPAGLLILGSLIGLYLLAAATISTDIGKGAALPW